MAKSWIGEKYRTNTDTAMNTDRQKSTQRIH